MHRAYSNEWQFALVKGKIAIPSRLWIEEGKRAWEARDLKPAIR